MIRYALTLFVCCSALATNYFVKVGGNDSSAGTSVATAFATLSKLQSTVVAGDKGYIIGGPFEEVLTPGASGSSTSARASYIGTNSALCRGVSISGKRFVLVKGLEISHLGTAFTGNGITLSTATNCMILHNNIHDVVGYGINVASGGNVLNVLQGNTINKCRVPMSTAGGGTGIFISGAYNIATHNEISRVSDFHGTFGGSNLFVHEFGHDVTPADFPAEDPHCDSIEASPDGTDPNIVRFVFAYNAILTNIVSSGHGSLLRNSSTTTNYGHIYAMNMHKYLESYNLICTIPSIHAYNCTWAECALLNTDVPMDIEHEEFDHGSPPTNSLAQKSLNHIFWHNNKLGTRIYYSVTAAPDFAPDGDLLFTTNGIVMGFAETHAFSSDPLFVSYLTHDLTLSALSPARATAQPQTTANGSGSSSTSLTVVDAGYYWDSYQVSAGCKIIIGTTAAVRVTGQSGNVLTLESARTWSNGDGIWLDGSKDIGAQPYGRPNVTAAVLTHIGTSYTCTVDGEVDQVVFTEDDLPVSTVRDFPFTYTSSGGTVTAIVYKMWSSYSTPFVVATDGGAGGSLAPTGLRGKRGR